MSRNAMFRIITVCCTLFVAADVGSAAAQPRVRPESAGPTADELQARAMLLVTDTDRYAESAALLVRAANLRASDDAVAVKDLLLAGKLYAYAGDLRVGRATLESAALRALSFGDVVTAAHAYVDAAFLAVRLGDGLGRNALVASAERLAESPNLTAAQRVAIMNRINPARAR